MRATTGARRYSRSRSLGAVTVPPEPIPTPLTEQSPASLQRTLSPATAAVGVRPVIFTPAECGEPRFPLPPEPLAAKPFPKRG